MHDVPTPPETSSSTAPELGPLPPYPPDYLCPFLLARYRADIEAERARRARDGDR